jgi:hypothetical protein
MRLISRLTASGVNGHAVAYGRHRQRLIGLPLRVPFPTLKLKPGSRDLVASSVTWQNVSRSAAVAPDGLGASTARYSAQAAPSYAAGAAAGGDRRPPAGSLRREAVELA